ncbi:MAG: response regulator [Lachnospiraceae bacterium]|nr:response regulator [Lachnospiraceae bacterium]
MKRLLNEFKEKIGYFVGNDININARNLYLCVIFGCLCSLVLFVYDLVIGMPFVVYAVNIAYFFECLAILYLAVTFGEYKRLVNIFCLFSSIVVYPVHCLINGDLYSFSVLYLVMGLILIIFLLDGIAMYIELSAAAVLDIIIIYCMYRYPQILRPYREMTYRTSTKYLHFIICIFIPLFILTYQTVLHEKMAKDVKEDDAIIRRKDLSKSRFLANMTQEIRVPMNAIIGMNELIMKEDLSEEAMEEAENIRDASDQLLRIVNDTLIYSRLVSERWELENSEYSFYEMMESVLNEFKETAFKFNIDSHAFVDADIPRLLYGDSLSIRQIFGFFLGNSLKQDARQRVALDIRGERIPENNSVRINCRISESGNGLKESEIEALLGAYKRYDTRQDSDIKGKGLEISICEELLKLMGGKLKIESIKGIGLSILFSFENYILDDAPMIEREAFSDKKVLIYLHSGEDEYIWKPLFDNLSLSPGYVMSPLTFKEAVRDRKYTHIFVKMNDYNSIKDTAAEAGIEDKIYLIVDHKRKNDSFGAIKILQPPISSIAVTNILNGVNDDNEHRLSESKIRASFKNARVLLVDDSHINLKIMTALIESFNIACDPVTSGEKCLEFLNDNDYDIIFLDHRMPGMDGRKTLKLIRDTGKGKDIPIICMTSEFRRNIKRDIISEGFDDCIDKPLKNSDLERIFTAFLPADRIVYEDPKLNTSHVNDRMKKSENTMHEYELKVNPLEFDMNRGIDNMGGDRDIYNEILLTYFYEGTEKKDNVLELSKKEDLSLFTTTVHALKSSSASVGAVGISELFRQFEMAGKASDRDFIDQNLANVVESFGNLLNIVESYLKDNGLLPDEKAEETEGSEVNKIDMDKLQTLYGYMDRFDLRNAETVLNQIAAENYDSHTNAAVKDIKNDFDMFEYFKAKDKVKDLIDKQTEG